MKRVGILCLSWRVSQMWILMGCKTSMQHVSRRWEHPEENRWSHECVGLSRENSVPEEWAPFHVPDTPYHPHRPCSTSTQIQKSILGDLKDVWKRSARDTLENRAKWEGQCRSTMAACVLSVWGQLITWVWERLCGRVGPPRGSKSLYRHRNDPGVWPWGIVVILSSTFTIKVLS